MYVLYVRMNGWMNRWMDGVCGYVCMDVHVRAYLQMYTVNSRHKDTPRSSQCMLITDLCVYWVCLYREWSVCRRYVMYVVYVWRIYVMYLPIYVCKHLLTSRQLRHNPTPGPIPTLPPSPVPARHLFSLLRLLFVCKKRTWARRRGVPYACK